MPQLVRDSVSRDMEQAAIQLLEEVRSGNVVGLAFGIALRGRKYFVNVAGILAKDPTYARGIVAALDDELARMVQGKADSDTTV